MTFFDVLTLFGGVALFLFGMTVMSTGLEKTAGSRLEVMLRNATSNRIKAFLLGIGVTSAIQSSTAVTVMLVGLVNSGIMQFQQTIGVIMGTNIGTTVTAWILSLVGITGSNIFVRLLSPDYFAQVFAVIGIVCVMMPKKSKRRNIGEILLGFAVLIAGMSIMRASVTGLEDSERFRSIMLAFSNPFLGVLIGAVVTAVLQSSSASVGILQAFALTTGISYSVAFPIIMGQNIGTCLTAVLSGIGANKNARRVSVVHVYFNSIGTLFFLVLMIAARSIFDFSFFDSNVTPFSIAIMHTAFNVTTTFMLFPFVNQLEKLARMTVKGKPGKEPEYELLDERLLGTPAVAIAQCHNIVAKMSRIARDTFLHALEMVTEYDEKKASVIRENEDTLDDYEDKLNTFLVKLSSQRLSNGNSWKISELLHIIGDLERIGDHALNILESAEELKDKGIEFSDVAKQDLAVAHAALTEIVNMAVSSFRRDNNSLARQVEPLEEAIDELVVNMRARHITRLQKGECSIIPGFVWTDLLINYERVSDHCSNMATCILQAGSKTMTRHTYLSAARSPDNPEFVAMLDAFTKKYSLND